MSLLKLSSGSLHQASIALAEARAATWQQPSAISTHSYQLACPALSQICNRTVRSSRYIVLARKSIPIVAL